MIILGVIDSKKYSRSNLKSKHMHKRKQREQLSLGEATLINCYKVKDNNCLQVHCLYTDGTVYVYNLKSGKIITIILLNKKRFLKYLEFTDEGINDYPETYKCVKLHYNKDKFTSEDIIRKKKQYLGI